MMQLHDLHNNLKRNITINSDSSDDMFLIHKFSKYIVRFSPFYELANYARNICLNGRLSAS